MLLSKGVTIERLCRVGEEGQAWKVKLVSVMKGRG